MVKFSYTLANWQTEIINSFYIAKTEYKLSRKTGQITVGYKRLNNALMERLNGTVKLITKAANGYTNWERFRNRCMLVLEKGIEFAIDEKDKSVKMVEKGAHHLGQVMSPLDPLNEIGYMPPQVISKIKFS